MCHCHLQWTIFAGYPHSCCYVLISRTNLHRQERFCSNERSTHPVETVSIHRCAYLWRLGQRLNVISRNSTLYTVLDLRSDFFCSSSNVVRNLSRRRSGTSGSWCFEALARFSSACRCRLASASISAASYSAIARRRAAEGALAAPEDDEGERSRCSLEYCRPSRSSWPRRGDGDGVSRRPLLELSCSIS